MKLCGYELTDWEKFGLNTWRSLNNEGAATIVGLRMHAKKAYKDGPYYKAELSSYGYFNGVREIFNQCFNQVKYFDLDIAKQDVDNFITRIDKLKSFT